MQDRAEVIAKTVQHFSQSTSEDISVATGSHGCVDNHAATAGTSAIVLQITLHIRTTEERMNPKTHKLERITHIEEVTQYFLQGYDSGSADSDMGMHSAGIEDSEAQKLL